MDYAEVRAGLARRSGVERPIVANCLPPFYRSRRERSAVLGSEGRLSGPLARAAALWCVCGVCARAVDAAPEAAAAGSLGLSVP
eukprot:2334132-Pyramimonas_sp.AAC.1